jgi:hypothetical protein
MHRDLRPAAVLGTDAAARSSAQVLSSLHFFLPRAPVDAKGIWRLEKYVRCHAPLSGNTMHPAKPRLRGRAMPIVHRLPTFINPKEDEDSNFKSAQTIGHHQASHALRGDNNEQ